MSNAWHQSEEEYVAYLAHERHMFAWCLECVGRVPKEEAQKAALDFYVYEPASDEHRGLAFHDEAWHWAMTRIKGAGYWRVEPDLEMPSEEYRAESKWFDERKTD